MAEAKKEYKLLIEFIFRVNKKLPFRKSPFPVQNQPFEAGLRIENYDSRAFPGGTIKGLRIASLDNKSLSHEFDEEFSIKKLNPGEETKVWWPKPLSTYLEGIIWIDCEVTPNNPAEEKIETYQYDKSTRAIDRYKHPNKWGDASYIKSRFELEQSRTNSLVLVLTGLTFLEGLFGIKEVVSWILGLLRSLLVCSVSLIDRAL